MKADVFGFSRIDPPSIATKKKIVAVAERDLASVSDMMGDAGEDADVGNNDIFLRVEFDVDWVNITGDGAIWIHHK